METCLKIKSLLIWFCLVSVLSISTLACSIGGISFGQDGATIDISLTEEQVNTLFKNVDRTGNTGADQLIDKVTGAELHNGFIRILGTTTTSDGKSVSGSFDVSVEAENDVLVAQIIGVNIPGIDMTDPRILDANEELSRELSETVTESNGDVLFKEASVTDDALEIVVQVKIQ